MAVIKPFVCVRPAEKYAAEIAALPYDVYDRAEAKEVVQKNPRSFLKIDRAETLFPDDQDMYAPEVYQKARSVFEEMLASGEFVRDDAKAYYLYELTMNGHSQTGLVGCASIDDYQNGVIKKHENTRADKELDRINHVDVMSAQTGPIFLAYWEDPRMKALTAQVKEREALYDFTGEDQVRHRVWKIGADAEIQEIRDIFEKIQAIYIADGHHRAASAVKVGLKRREAHPEYDGTEEFNYFLSVTFPAEELKIFDYNRVVKDKNGKTTGELLAALKEEFTVEEAGTKAYAPKKKGEFGMYCDGTWYCLEQKNAEDPADPVKALDVSVLQDQVLEPLFGIQDPKTDERIAFVGGIRGLDALKVMADKTGGVAFSMYPTSMDELLSVADAGLLMPPKSTWFEPKLKSGIFIHEIEK